MEIDPNVFLQYGISGFIAVYLVYFITAKLNSKLDNLTKAINNLRESIEKLREDIKYGTR